jgi:hypothetical protein
MVTTEMMDEMILPVLQYLKLYGQSNFVFDTGLTRRFLGLHEITSTTGRKTMQLIRDFDVTTTNAIDYARHLDPAHPGKLLFLSCENFHWRLFIVDCVECTVATMDSLAQPDDAIRMTDAFLPRFRALMTHWGFDGDAFKSQPSAAYHQTDGFSCAYFVWWHVLEAAFPGLHVDDIETARMTAVIAAMFQELPLCTDV